MSAEENAENVSDIESSLSNLAPLRPRFERDQLMYMAGRDAGIRSPRRAIERFVRRASYAAMVTVTLAAVVWGGWNRKRAEVFAWQLSSVQAKLNSVAVPIPAASLGGGTSNETTADPPLLEREREAIAAADRADAARTASLRNSWKLRASQSDGRGPSNTGYFRLRDQMLAFGVDGIPGTATRDGGGAATSSSYRELLKANAGNW